MTDIETVEMVDADPLPPPLRIAGINETPYPPLQSQS